MGAPKPIAVIAGDAVLAAFDAAKQDDSILTADEAAALDEQIAAGEARIAAGERPYRTADEALAKRASIEE